MTRSMTARCRLLVTDMGPRSAFTLVETLAVLVILGILASVLIVRFAGGVGRGKQELAKTGIGIIVQKVEMFRVETNDWPPNDLGLAALSDGHATPSAAYYLGSDQLKDPWKRPYVFVTPGPDGQPYEVVSYGRDGQPGGEGEDGDVTSAHLRGT